MRQSKSSEIKRQNVDILNHNYEIKAIMTQVNSTFHVIWLYIRFRLELCVNRLYLCCICDFINVRLSALIEDHFRPLFVEG